MLRLRQVALAAWDLERASENIRATLDLAPPFRDPGVGVFGLHNVVFVLGDTFLEVVSPLRDDASAARFLRRGGGDRGYMAIFQTDDLAHERRRLEALGVRIVWETRFDDIATIHLHPRDVGGAIVSIDEARPPQSWRWAGEGWERKADRSPGAICAVEVASRDAEAIATRWSEVLARPLVKQRSRTAGAPTQSAAGDAACAIALDGSAVRFLACSGTESEGIAGVDVIASDPERILRRAQARDLPVGERELTICGTRFRLRDRATLSEESRRSPGA